MQYLVTGGAGFIGSHVCDTLLDAGHQVIVVDDLSTGHWHNLQENIKKIESDCADEAVLRDIIPQVDGVFHLAAVASVQRSREEWVETSRINQLATVALLEAIKKDGRQIPFVYASSAATYGDPDASLLPISEDVPQVPLTPYGADKLGSELHARIARLLFGIPTLGLRFFNVFGPRQDPSSPYSGVISIFVNRLSQGQGVTIFGDGGQTRDFIYVSDVVAHLAASMKTLHAGNQPHEAALNVCTGTQVSVKELAEIIAEICNVSPEISYADAREGDIRYSQGNPARASEVLGVNAVHDFREGLQQTIG